MESREYWYPPYIPLKTSIFPAGSDATVISIHKEPATKISPEQDNAIFQKRCHFKVHVSTMTSQQIIKRIIYLIRDVFGCLKDGFAIKRINVIEPPDGNIYEEGKAAFDIDYEDLFFPYHKNLTWNSFCRKVGLSLTCESEDPFTLGMQIFNNTGKEMQIDIRHKSVKEQICYISILK